MLIFLYGADSYRSRQKMIEIKEKYLRSDPTGSGLLVFDGEEEKNLADKIRNVLGTANLFYPKRLLIIKNFLSEGDEMDQKKLLDYLEKEKIGRESEDAVAIFWEGSVPKKNNSLFKFFQKYSRSQNFEKLTGAKLNQWALKELKNNNSQASISKLALEKLISYCQGDATLISLEINKLGNYAGEKMIKEEDVELLVKAHLSGNIFQMVDALGANNKKEALSLFHKHLIKGDDPFYLMSMFFYQFRNMLKVADLWENNIRSEQEISRITKLHPFVVKKSLAQIARFPFSKLKNIYQKLGELDTAVKTGKMEIKLALDKFIAEI